MASSVQTEKEWHPNKREVKRLMKLVRVYYTLHLLETNKEIIGRQTFREHGLYLVLLSACHAGAIDVISYFLDNHKHLFNVNETFKYGYTQEWNILFNHVIILEDTIGFIEDEKEERKDTLLSFTKKYECRCGGTDCLRKRYDCKCKDEVIQLLQRHGAKDGE